MKTKDLDGLTKKELERVIEAYKPRYITIAELEEFMQIAGKDPVLLNELIQRRKEHEPMAYLRGFQEFYGRRFTVDRRVYVPNKETELLVGALLEHIKEGDTFIDIGTGCGNIAITIKLERPDVYAYACDINEKALEIAIENARTHHVDVAFLLSDYVNNTLLPEPKYIIADLPWGTSQTVLHDAKELRYMPDVALFHPDGSLGAQQGLITSIRKRGWNIKVLLETGYVPQTEVAKIIPDGAEWEYRIFGRYSTTILNLGGVAHEAAT